MGKKGTWCCVDKRLFTSNSKPLNEGEKKSRKEKKKGRRGRLKRASFIPLFREPSSIEEILGDVDQHHLQVGHHPITQPQPDSPTQPEPQPHFQPAPEPQPQPQPQPHFQPEPEPQPQPQPQPQFQPQPKQKPKPQPSSSSGRPVSPPPQKHTSPPRIAVHQQPKINHTPEPTLQHHHLSATRIQAVYRGYMTRRNIRGLTGLVRLQRVLTSQNVKRQTVNAMKQMQLLVRVQTQIQSRRNQMLKNQALKQQPHNSNPHKKSETGDEYWDDSVITKEERDARLKRKEDAVIRREKAMAYAYSHQLRKETPTSSHQSDGYPWWWKWLEPQLPYPATPTPPSLKNHQFATRTYKQLDSPPTRPMSSSSTNRSIKYSKARKRALYPKKDDDSLMSCPPFSVPNYMSPTVSARAKARPTSNPKERCVTPTTPASVSSSKRRFSFPFTPNTNSQVSIGELSMDSAISVTASVGRKPFNRFV